MTDEIVPQKVCVNCKQSFPATTEYFHRNKLTKDKLRPTCKACHCAEVHEYRVNHLEDVKARERTRSLKYQSGRTERSRKYRREHPEKKKEYDKRYREKHHVIKSPKEPKPKKVKSAEQLARYREGARQYRRSEHGKYLARISNQNRRARQSNTEGSYTASDLTLKILSQTDKRGKLHCWWCGKIIPEAYHIDHIIPLSRGGSNAPENLCIACPPCNMSKHDKLPQEWNGRLL